VQGCDKELLKHHFFRFISFLLIEVYEVTLNNQSAIHDMKNGRDYAKSSYVTLGVVRQQKTKIFDPRPDVLMSLSDLSKAKNHFITWGQVDFHESPPFHKRAHHPSVLFPSLTFSV
jgi:hypothetical protein